MSYSDQVRPGKDSITGDQIANGAIELRHLAPTLFAEFRQIQLHRHTGVKSVRVKAQDLEGSFTQDGILMRSPDGSVWKITVDNTGTLSTTEVG